MTPTGPAQELPRRPRQVVDAAAALGVELVVTAFPEGTRTAQDAAAAIGCSVDQIVKSLVFVADGAPVLVLTSGGNRVDIAKVRALLGAAEVRKADAAEVREATGYAIGGTPPLGHARKLAVLIDRHLGDFGEVWAAAGTHEHVFPIAFADLVRASRGRLEDVAE